ncbi:MAG: pyruvate formate-lyase-activating protein [Luteibaculaceae bacterium]
MVQDNLVGSRYEFNLSKEAETILKTGNYPKIEIDDAQIKKELESGNLGYIHSVEVGSTVDGPGLRFVLFLTGCKLRCQYCHNPDTWHLKNGKPYTLDKIMHKINQYTEVLKISNGGLTISGGEPGMQSAFVKNIFKEAKKLSLHTCIDTSGFLGEDFSDTDLLDIDLHLLDIKAGDPVIYQEVTRKPLQPTLNLAKRLSDLGRPVWVRFVLVPGLTDSWDNVEKLADICAGIKSLERVEILRFHQMGKNKWEKLNIPYTLANTETPTKELAERVRQQFRSRGLVVY